MTDHSGIHSALVPSQLLLPSARAHTRILLADDDDELRSVMQAFLRDEGYEVFAFANAARALEVAGRREDIDLLLTDLQMPGMSGFELATSWGDKHPGRPVVIVSGTMLHDEQMALILERGWHFVPKPFRVPRLLSVLTRSLESQHRAIRT